MTPDEDKRLSALSHHVHTRKRPFLTVAQLGKLVEVYGKYVEQEKKKELTK